MENRILKIAIIEDNEGDVVLIREMLASAYMSIDHYSTLEAGLEALEFKNYDVALVDLGLPGCVGADAPVMIMNENPNIPVIVLTASDDLRLIRQLFKYGAQDYLIKGKFEKDALIRSLRYSIERKKVMDDLYEQKAFAENLIENAHAAVLVLDHNFDILLVNKYFEDLSGFKASEIRKKNWLDIFTDKEIKEDVCTNLSKAFDGEMTEEYVQPVKIRDGSVRIIEWHYSAVRNRSDNTTGLLCIGHDITKRKDLEEQLRQSQKMEAIGLLAGGIAHDFNNLLMVILCNCDLMLAGIKKDDPMAEDIVEIKRSGQRAAELTKQLLAFSRKQVLKQEIIDLNFVVSDLEKMIKRLTGERIDIVTVLSPKTGAVKADRGQLDQIVMNLVVNARDAMPKGGKITIETGNVELDDEYMKKYSDVKPGNYAMLAITDSGAGMSKETVEKIFEPFFTTKGVGKGTGLGLSTVYGIVKQSEGYIYCYSEPGRGTTFKIYLPVVNDDFLTETEAQIKEELVSHGENIVMIDDEKDIRDVVRRMLEQEGYNVFEAANFKEVKKHFRDNKIDLLITDVIMPEMNGDEIGEEILKEYPGTKIIYMSGYTESTIMDFSLLDKNKIYLQKPFSRQSIVQSVREILNS